MTRGDPPHWAKKLAGAYLRRVAAQETLSPLDDLAIEFLSVHQTALELAAREVVTNAMRGPFAEADFGQRAAMWIRELKEEKEEEG